MNSDQVLLTTTENVGRPFIVLGIIYGVSQENVFNGNADFTQIMVNGRNQAIQNLQNSAAQVGADAVVSLRITTGSINQNVKSITAYGTAIKYN